MNAFPHDWLDRLWLATIAVELAGIALIVAFKVFDRRYKKGCD